MLNELEHYKLTNTLCGRSKVANDNSSECSYDTHQLPGKDCEGTSGSSSHSLAALPEHEHIVRHAVRHCSCGSCQRSTRQQRRQAAPHRPTHTHGWARTSARLRCSLISSVVPSLVSSVVSSVKVFSLLGRLTATAPFKGVPRAQVAARDAKQQPQHQPGATRCRLCEDERAESNAPLGAVQARAITAAALTTHHCTAAWQLSCSAFPATVFRLQLSPPTAQLPACRLLLPARLSFVCGCGCLLSDHSCRRDGCLLCLAEWWQLRGCFQRGTGLTLTSSCSTCPASSLSSMHCLHSQSSLSLPSPLQAALLFLALTLPDCRRLDLKPRRLLLLFGRCSGWLAA